MDEKWEQNWVARFKGVSSPHRVTLVHYCESTVGTRLITSCGKQMERTNSDGTMGTTEMTMWAACDNCLIKAKREGRVS